MNKTLNERIDDLKNRTRAAFSSEGDPHDRCDKLADILWDTLELLHEIAGEP